MIKELSQVLAGPILQLVSNEIKFQQKHALKDQWTECGKSLALSLYHANPKAYTIVQTMLPFLVY